MTAPTAIFKGDADDLADVQDIDRLVKIVFFLNKIIYIRINVALVIKQSLVYIFTSMTFLDQRSSRTIEKL